MNNFIRIFLLLFVQVSIYPQVCFVKSISTSEEEIPYCIRQMGNTCFASIRTCNEQFGIWQGTNLIKFNSDGETQAELDFEINENNFFSIETILPLSQSAFITVGRYKNQSDANAYIYIMKVDTSLQVLWENRFAVNKPLIGNITSILDEDTNILIGASCETFMPDWKRELLFLKVNTNGDSIQANYEMHGNPYGNSIHSLLDIDGQYKAFVNGYSAYTNNNCFSEILQLDSCLNLVEVRPAPYIIEVYTTAERINDKQYYLAGMVYSSATHYDVGIAKLSNMEDSLAYNHAGKPGKAVDYSGWKQCMSIANSNSIYTGGTGNDNGLFYSCNTTTKVLMLSNYDSLLNCRWTRFYGSDTACYTLSTLEATSDGGCIMGGMFYTPSRPENLLDVVILKVDSLGLFTNLPKNAFVRVQDAIVYPNPGHDYLVIQSGPQIAGAGFRLYDAAGCAVLESTLNSTNEQITTSMLPPGVYPWQIIHKGKLIEQGKWVKY
jgi:hypothetical protein